MKGTLHEILFALITVDVLEQRIFTESIGLYARTTNFQVMGVGFGHGLCENALNDICSLALVPQASENQLQAILVFSVLY